MTTYTAIPDADVAAERPITTGLMTKLRDNPIAIIEGAPGAPKATARIITPGGSAADGPLDDAATPTLPGFYEATLVEITAPKSWPWISLVRVDGDVTISDVLSLRRPKRSALADATQTAVLQLFGGLTGVRGAWAAGDDSSGGGGVIGQGNRGDASTSLSAPAVDTAAYSNSYRAALNRLVLVGGNAAQGPSDGTDDTRGGGCLILIVNGDCDLTGGTLDCSGNNGETNGSGGGGGGSIIVICTGTITGGTFLAAGGDGDGGGPGEHGGGGGGGLVGLFASTFTGTQTVDVTGGTGGPGLIYPGAAGLSLGNTVLTGPQINALMLGLTGR